MDVSVVVCAHEERRWPYIEVALESIRRQTLAPREVILVVDHNDELFERAMQAFADVRVVRNDGQRGLGGARNTGIAASSSSIVSFLDDDAVAGDHWLELLVEPYANSSVAGVGGAIHPIWDAGDRPDWLPYEFDWVVGATYRGLDNRVHDVRNLIGCNMSFRRDVLEQLGRFRLGYGCDETELCIRLQQRWPHRRLVYVPDAFVKHHVASERARFAYFVRRCYFEGGSKAVVSKLVGRADALSSERRYTLRALPTGVLQGVRDAVRGDAAGLARAGAIVAGLAVTSAGYVGGLVRADQAARRRGWEGASLARP